MQVAIAKLDEGPLAFAGEDAEDPLANAKFADLLSRHLRAAEKEAEAAAQNLSNLEQQLKDLQQEIALLKRDTAAKAAANLPEFASEEGRWDQPACELCPSAEGGPPEGAHAGQGERDLHARMESANGAALLTDEALFSFLTRAPSFWVGIAEDAQKEMWMSEPGDAAGDQGADAYSGQRGGAGDDVL